MSLDVMTLALAKSYTDQHGGGGGGGENTIYIPATLKSSDDSDMPTIETSVTFEQIKTAYESGQEQILKLFTDDSGEFAYLLPLVVAEGEWTYYFETIFTNQAVFAYVMPTNEWEFFIYDFSQSSISKEEIVNDVLAALPRWTGGRY